MAIRIKSHWFKGAGQRSPGENASAMAFIAWRAAQNMLKEMRGAGFDIDVGPVYFAFLREAAVFLVCVADRMAYEAMPAEDRTAFTTAMVRRVADFVEENQSEWLGPSPAGQASHGDSFVDLYNEMAEHYAEFGHGAEGPAFGFYRYLASRVQALLPAKDHAWVIDQVISWEGPEAVKMLRDAMPNVLSKAARPARRAGVSGD